MGLAKIISGGPTGKYDIELVRDTAKISATIKAIDARLIILAKGIAAALLEKAAAENVLNTKRGALDAAIGNLILGIIKQADVTKPQKEYLDALTLFQNKSTAYSLLIQEQESKTKQKKLLQDALTPQSRNGVWCADLTEDLIPGEEVGTIEVNGEASIAPIIYPGGDYDNLPSSKLQPTQASTPAGVFYNAALFAAWQRWKPTYRVGTIISITGNNCNLLLDSARSTAQQLNINPLTLGGGPVSLASVPVDYMNGVNSDVFVPGDRVVVEFTDRTWATPKVIGFESNPRGPGSVNGYYIFYKEGSSFKIAHCRYGNSGINIIATKSAAETSTLNGANGPVTFHLKKFMHVGKELYFVATSLLLHPSPMPGWVSFAAAHPDFPLVTNKLNTSIPLTKQVQDDLATVNVAINHMASHLPDTGNDNWQFPVTGVPMDCEDAALGKARALLNMGYPASAIHIETGYPEGTTAQVINGQSILVGHAWLVVQTDKGDYALDINIDDVVKNSTLTVDGKSLYGRRRQIGMNWASISPFAWLTNATNQDYVTTNPDEPYPVVRKTIFLYILDPMLNIIYRIPDVSIDGLMTADVYDNSLFADEYFSNPVSVNFSSDFIYVTRPLLQPVPGSSPATYTATDYRSVEKYHLGANELILDASAKQVRFVNTSWNNNGAGGAPSPGGIGDLIYQSTSDANTFIFMDKNGVLVGWENMHSILSGSSLYTRNYTYSRTAVGTHEVISKSGCYDHRFIYETTTGYGNWGGGGGLEWGPETPVEPYDVSSRSAPTIPATTNSVQVQYMPNIVMGRTIESTFKAVANIYNNYHYLTPFGERIDMGNAWDNAWQRFIPSHEPRFWIHIDADNVLIQSFMMKPFAANPVLHPDAQLYNRMYKNGAPCLAAVKAAVSVADDANLLGLVIIPGADRL
jgi:predicted transglutaminase-like cysteine proteinase